MTEEERKNIHSIFYASRVAQPCMELFRRIKTFPNLKTQTCLWHDFSRIFGFSSKEHFLDILCAYQPEPLQSAVRELMGLVEDYSIATIFHQTTRKYKFSSFIDATLTNITKFKLPNDYFVICPYSSNDKRDIRRDYNDDDWDNTIDILTKLGVPGVVINRGEDKVPAHSSLMNLSNQTAIWEAIEIVKNAKGYIGIDTGFSVVSAKCHASKNIIIKSHNDHCYRWAHCYFAPKQSFEFLKCQITRD